MNYVLLKKYTMNINVLFVEDDSDFRKEFYELLLDIFPKVETAKDGLDALNKYKEYFKKANKYYDLVITDIKMPNLDGIDLVSALYEIKKDQMVIVLSARNEFDYLLPLINLGIYQFFTKPIDYSIFLEDMFKLCSQIYYTSLNKNTNIIRINEYLTWDKEKKNLLQNDKSIKLTKNEFKFVETILSNNGRVFTADELINIIWYEEFDLEVNITNLKSLIYRLRKKVPGFPIKNIYGMGYKFDVE